MRYFHRTSVTIDDVLVEADRYFGARLETTQSTPGARRYSGSVGEVSLTVRAEGGHYTLVTLTTSDVGESEVDKFAKRFLSTVHSHAHHGYDVRGAY